ncbi:gamma-glutamylcyclotransferase, partial [Erwinia amylovora]|uniref:gamma-glutamylcyclotransferase n=1 Tax=Erwinia amylovora TaxID=552 RepID=UPI00385587D9
MTNALWMGFQKIDGYSIYILGHYTGVVTGDGRVYCEVYRLDAATLGALGARRPTGGEYRRERGTTPAGSAWLAVSRRS